MGVPPIKLLIINFAISLSGSFHNGFLTIIPNNAAISFQTFLNGSFYAHQGIYLNASHFDYVWPLFMNLMTIGGFVGSLLIKKLTEKLGRKRCFYVVVAFQLTGCLASALSYFLNSWELLSIGRLLSGIAIGISLGLQPMYFSEISPKAILGFLNSMTGVTVQLGFIVGSIASLPVLLGTSNSWHWLFWIEIAITLSTLVCVPFIHESPKYLIAKKHDYDGARKSLSFFLHEDVEEDLKDIEKEVSSESETVGLATIFKKAYLKRGLLIGSLILIACQCSGIGAIACYSTLLFEKVGIPSDIAPYATVGLTFVLLISTIISSFIIERVGRRKLVLVGLISLAVLNLIYIIFAYIGTQINAKWPAYVCIAENILFVFMFGIGPANAMWFVIAEIMPQSARSTAVTFAQASQWVVGCLANSIFFPLSNAINEWSFLMFVIILVSISIYLYIKFPETKNKTTLEIMNSLGYKEENRETSEKLKEVPSKRESRISQGTQEKEWKTSQGTPENESKSSEIKNEK